MVASSSGPVAAASASPTWSCVMTATHRFNVLVEARFLLDLILRAIDDALEFAAEIAAP